MTEIKRHGPFAEKISKFEEWIEGDHVLVHLDSRSAGVKLPDHLRDNPSLTLKLSYLFQGTTTYDEEAVTTYLKFSGDYRECVLPWSGIWGLTSADGKQMVWPKDMPNELLIAFAKQQLGAIGKRFFGKSEKKVAVETTAIDSERQPSEAAPDTHETPLTEIIDKPASSPEDKPRGHLRRVK